MFENQYLTYDEYHTDLKGSLTEDAFNLLEFEARAKIDDMTSGRLKDLDTQIDEVKLCIFKLISVLNENNTSIKSESVDGYSITLMDTNTLEKAKETIIREYLSNSNLDDYYNTPYLYRGFNGVDCVS